MMQSNFNHVAIVLALGLGLAGAAHAQAQERSFFSEGSDTIMAVGARHIAMGGTGTATANDPYAIFYNPARLAGLERPTFSINRQIDATLRPYSFLGVALPLGFTEPLGFDMTLGVARYNRVHARSFGAFGEDEPESIFLRYLLPGLTGTFDGDIDSKTLVTRFALGVQPHGIPGLEIGANLDWIDCKTETCGVHGSSNGFERRSIRATALSFGLSASYQLGEAITLAAAYTDINTTLNVQTTVTDDLGTRASDFEVGLPRKLNVEAAWQVNETLLAAFGYQRFWGEYGNYTLNFETLHAGVEYARTDEITWRAGAWGALDISASNGLDFELPIQVAPTLGIGWHRGNVSADLGVYGHPLMTLHEREPHVSADLSLSYRF